MTKKELIEFGQKLIEKGRTPTEIHNAIAIKSSSKKLLNEVLEQIFINEKPTIKRSPERTKDLLNANKLKLNLEYSMKGLLRISVTILIVGGITYGLSSIEVNQNEVFGWTTLSQGLIVTILFLLVKYKGLMNLLLPAVIIYFSIWLIELLIWGMPNDLLEVYNSQALNVPPRIKLNVDAGIARIIGFIFPFVYLGVKLFLGWFIYLPFRNHLKYEALTQDVKDDLIDF
ncbi:MAG: hypothetical protein HRT57_10785 [Crocinitomicaceae bacterium]|nr:hypothetical protein [Crocinitomicaceae bacterium]